jgi:hypothetical protein
MLHFLLILLALLGIWKLLAHSGTSSTSLLTGLRRLSFVLATLGAALGGLIGYAESHHCTYNYGKLTWLATEPVCTGPDPGAIVLGAAIGFGAVWGASAVLVWIVKGFVTN